MKNERTGGWRVVGASVAGSAHLLRGLPCQDRHAVKIVPDAAGTDILVVAVADGAGFATRADAGADIAVEGFLNRVQNAIAARPFAHVSVVECRDWLLATRQALLDAAAADGLLPRDLAATFAAAVVAPGAAFALQIGDGIIAAQPPPSMQIASGQEARLECRSRFFVRYTSANTLAMRNANQTSPGNTVGLAASYLFHLCPYATAVRGPPCRQTW